ncbi:hypothetical protein O4H61_03355 [Roseovarius aestuarii]|nr:hypothetical protein [Roseovarius aestuarii]
MQSLPGLDPLDRLLPSRGEFFSVELSFDLFGNPSQPGQGQRGRPRYQATEKDRNKVKMLLALGWGNQRIANALDVSLATLKRYFRADLQIREVMRDRLVARQFEIALEHANAGNMSALKELDRLMEKNDRMYAERSLRRDQADEDPREKMGKKERAALDAEEAVDSADWQGDLQYNSGSVN